MRDAASMRRILASFDDPATLGRAWEGQILRGRLLVPDEPEVELLEQVIVDLAVDGEVVASLWAQAVSRVEGGGGLGLAIPELPRATVDAIAELLAADHDGTGTPAPEDDGEAPVRASGGSDTSRPIALRYKELPATEKMQLALRGGRDARLQVMKEGNPQLLKYLLRNPRMSAKEVGIIAGDTGTPMDVLKLIADHPQHAQNEMVRLALVKNPRTPIPLVRKHIDKLPRRHIAQLAKSDHVRAEVQRLARKLAIARRP